MSDSKSTKTAYTRPTPERLKHIRENSRHRKDVRDLHAEIDALRSDLQSSMEGGARCLGIMGECVEMLDDAGMGSAGMGNCLVDMVREACGRLTETKSANSHNAMAEPDRRRTEDALRQRAGQRIADGAHEDGFEYLRLAERIANQDTEAGLAQKHETDEAPSKC